MKPTSKKNKSQYGFNKKTTRKIFFKVGAKPITISRKTDC